MHFHKQVPIACPPAKLWPLLTEPERIKTWIVELVDDVPEDPAKTSGVGVVSTMRMKEGGKVVSYRSVVTAWELERKVAVRLTGGSFAAGMAVDVTYDITPTATGSLLKFSRGTLGSRFASWAGGRIRVMKLRLPSGVFASDIGIDLGTANTLLFVRGQGIVLSEPSIVAVDRESRAIIAVGQEARAMLGRAPGKIEVIRPLRDGVIADFDVAQKMLQTLISRVQPRGRIMRPRLVIGVSSSITQVEKRAVREAGMQAGASAVHLVQEPMAAAIGAGLPIQAPGGHLVVDIGGGTTEVAVISLSGIVYSQSVRTAGDDMNEAITQYIRKQYNLLVGERRVEDLKLALSAARPAGEGPRTLDVKGSDLVGRVPKTVRITEDEVREAIADCVGTIVETVRVCLERTPPEIAADMVDNGIVLTGGGALLAGLDDIIRKETYLPVTVAANALSCVALGIGALLDDLPLLERVAIGR